MLNVQRYLRTNGLDALKNEFGIKFVLHSDGRLILNYDQIESAKSRFNPIVRECRGLVLDYNNNYDLVARSFYRFFNYGEHQESDKNFCWKNHIATEKLDGSLILLYYWNGNWHINTKGSFGDGIVGESKYTWRDLVLKSLRVDPRDMNKGYSYVMELCSPYNKVVRTYNNTHVKLLTAFYNTIECDYSVVENIANNYELDLPDRFVFSDINDLQSYLVKRSETDPTFEGVVLHDYENDIRIKVKAQKYIMLHKQFSGELSNENILDIILQNEQNEVLIYYPELKPRFDDLVKRVNDLKREIDEVWNTNKLIPNRKDFALSIKHLPYSYYLFSAYSNNQHPNDFLFENKKLLLALLY